MSYIIQNKIDGEYHIKEFATKEKAEAFLKYIGAQGHLYVIKKITTGSLKMKKTGHNTYNVAYREKRKPFGGMLQD